MKITSYRNTGGVVTQRVLTLENALNAMRAETKSKPVSALRHNLQFIPPGVQSDYTEKLPVRKYWNISALRIKVSSVAERQR